MRKRNRHVSVWMNEQEYRHLKKQAELAGLGIDPFLRALTAGVQLRPRPPDTYAALLRELSAAEATDRLTKATPTPPCSGSCRPSAIM